jgi:hypothetical protein
LPGLPDPPVRIQRHDNRTIIDPPDGQLLPLHVDGQHLAGMKVTFNCQMDSVGTYMAVKESKFDLLAKVDRQPILRIHYLHANGSRPTAHVHVHGHRGAISHLLSQSGHETPHDLSSLHIPMGGSRFRPCLEDFIQFLICECKFDACRTGASTSKRGASAGASSRQPPPSGTHLSAPLKPSAPWATQSQRQTLYRRPP